MAKEDHDLIVERHELNNRKILKVGQADGLIPSAAIIIEHIANYDKVRKLVVLADVYHKPAMEFPSSTAVAIKDAIAPHLTSNSVNCGMALVKTNLKKRDLQPQLLDHFFRSIRKKFPRNTWKKTISEEEVLKAVSYGAEWAIERYEFGAELLKHIAHYGNLFRRDQISSSTAKRFNPQELLDESGFNFGQIGKSNHFIELQVIEEILDKTVASEFGLYLGQVVIMYHGGGGPYCGLIGKLFVPRNKRVNWKNRLYTLRLKIPFHFSDTRQLQVLKKRLGLYFMGKTFSFIPADNEEFERFLTYNNFAMNYGYAYRIATLSHIRDVLKDISKDIDISLAYDLPHNVICREVLNGEELIIHRHNSTMAYPRSRMGHHEIFKNTGQPILLPGTNRTSSYLCVAEEGTKEYLYSVDHGAGNTVKSFISQSMSRPVQHFTRRYYYDSDEVGELYHYDDAGVNFVLRQLQKCNMVSPVARLRPVAGLT
jgi:RNA-splicing ligase RtcB